ncbi:MAG: response regulator [Bryobacterales bacterium]|nr:response regulator [Bryobacterales bacterium]MBV9398081.1 response regulator [Bryobacterales bacterium]
MSTAATPLWQIVLAEDNPGDIMLVRMALRDAGLSCALTVLEDGAKAITLIEQLDENTKAPKIDLLLLDLHLPKRDGEDILRRLRSTERNAQAPVIVMTAPTRRTTMQRLRNTPQFTISENPRR